MTAIVFFLRLLAIKMKAKLSESLPHHEFKPNKPACAEGNHGKSVPKIGGNQPPANKAASNSHTAVFR